MRYRNLKTGAIFDSPCSISGGDWVAEETLIAIKTEIEEVVEVKKVEVIKGASKEAVEVEEPEKEKDDIDGITKKEIMQELDAMGIKYNPRDNKGVLYKLMLGE